MTGQISSWPEIPRRPRHRLDVAPSPEEAPDGSGKACLKASVLLSRRARRSVDRGDEQTFLAMSQVLDTLHRSAGGVSGPVPGAMLSSLTRLVDHLERIERGPHRDGDAPGSDSAWSTPRGPGRGSATP